ncbi:MAG: glycosyltransferase family 1 protein [Patescibacteria group bacterium]|nr:glycosyltransferase family 1 protein [Patescibacteria group bacterium]
MRIGIEARMMGPENTRGVGRYIQELVTAMIEVAPENDYVLVTRTSDHALSGRVETVVADLPLYSWKEQMQMGQILKDLKADIIHIPHWNVPLGYSGPLVTTIHDLLLRHQPDSAKTSTRSWPIRLAKRLGFRLVLDHAIKSSRRICVPTEFTKQDLLNFYPAANGKVVVTGEGITSLNRSSKLVSRDSRFEIPDSRFVLYVGSAYPHKRLDLLIEAWKEASRQWPDMELVIAGELDVFMRKLQLETRKVTCDTRHVKQSNESQVTCHKSRVKFLGKVSDSQLSELYQGALALVFPSSFEGFGLTPLEALAYGCPVVSSDSTCLPEVLGKKGVIYFKSGSKDGMLGAIKTVVDNQKEFQKQTLEAGVELAARHSWKQAAAKTLQAYQSAVLG